MTQEAATPGRGWRYGIHPNAVGSEVRSISRVELPLGESLRIEMSSPAQAGNDVVHLQYYIDTEAGGWSLWVSCPPSETADREAVLRDIALPFPDGA